MSRRGRIQANRRHPEQSSEERARRFQDLCADNFLIVILVSTNLKTYDSQNPLSQSF